MPPATTPGPPGRLGLLLPPMPPVGSGTTTIATTIPTFGSTAWVSSLAAAAEAAGAGGVWASDHLFWRRPATECLTTLAVAAAATHRATVGACVLQLPLRAPAAVAKQAAALQTLSGGRFVLGVGVGSHPGEYARAGVAFRTRGSALDAGLDALHAAWREGSGDDYLLSPAPHVPVWLGGSSPAALRRAATRGDGWVPLFVSPDEYADALGQLREMTVEAGRTPEAVMPAVVMVARVGDDAPGARAAGAEWLSSLYGIPPRAFERHLVAGPPERCAAGAEAYLAAGAAHVIVLVAADDASEQFRALVDAFGRAEDRGVPSAGTSRRSYEMAEVGA